MQLILVKGAVNLTEIELVEEDTEVGQFGQNSKQYLFTVFWNITSIYIILCNITLPVQYSTHRYVYIASHIQSMLHNNLISDINSCEASLDRLSNITSKRMQRITIMYTCGRR